MHDVLSSRVLMPLYRLQRLAIPARRPVMREFYKGLRFRSAAATWEPDRRREWILRRLRFSVRRAYRTTEYYRDLFRRIGFDPEQDFGFDEFARIPVLDRSHVHAAGRALVSSGEVANQLRKDATGGSTGTPTEVWRGPEERGWNESGSEWYMRRIGVPAGSRKALLWGHHLDPVASDRFMDRLRDFAENQEWFDCFRLSPEILEAYHQRLQSFRPRCMIAYASALATLAEAVRDSAQTEPAYPTRCFVTGAEKLLPHHRQLIQEVFGRPVHERYGSRDVALMGFQVAVDRSLDFEVDWANVLIEPESAERESPILVTKLHADGMPMLRYRVGDVARFPAGSKSGHPTFVLHEVLGRDTDRVWLPDGRWVHGIGFPHLMKDYPVKEFQVVQAEDYSVVLHLVPGEGFTNEDVGRISETVRTNLPGIPLSTRLVDRVERTSANKWRPVITKINGRSMEGTK